MNDMTIIVYPTKSGHVRIFVWSDGPAETLMTPDEARELIRRLLLAVRVADGKTDKTGLDVRCEACGTVMPVMW